MNAATRIFYGMARSGVLPKAFTKVHPVYKTPVNAVWLQTGLNVLLGILLPLLIGVGKVYSVTGFMFTFAVIPVYLMANLGVFILYRRDFRSEFNVLWHVAFPAVSSVALIVLGYESLNPWPASPNNAAPIIVVIWLGIGILLLAGMIGTGRQSWLNSAGQAIADVPETAEQRAHHQAGI